jgi:aspartyl-tRNA(Asn)/glutamyl-tRNA(Gln) amidotransferase subunit A
VNAEDVCRAPIRRLAAMLRTGRISAPELLDIYLGRIAANKTLKAFITVDPATARAEARRVGSRRAGSDYRPLLGIPLAVKDLFATRGQRTTGGSRILRDWRPASDAIAVARLRAAGAVVIGKTNLHEFAYGVTNANPWWGAARNPWDPERIPGGSSGGSAIAVAAGLAAAAVGSDTGGSIRIPAALCGCVGLKPTYGAIPVDGIIPLGWSLDHAGPLARTVADARLLFEVMAARRLKPPPTLAGLRLGIIRAPLLNRVEEGVSERVEAATRALGRAGLRLSEVRIPELEWTVAMQLITLRAEASALHARWLRRRPRAYGADVRIRLQLGSLVSGPEYASAQRARLRLKHALEAVFKRVDILLLPATPIVAPPLGQRTVRWQDGEEPVDAALVRLTQPFNLAGVPALSVPCGRADGLPVGLQLVAPWMEESRLLAVGTLLESLQPAETPSR